MQLRHYAWVIRHWLWLILLGTVICTGATYVISEHMKPAYEASALVQVNGVGTSDVFSNQALANSYSLLLNDTDVLQEVVKRVPGVDVEQLQSAVSVAPANGTQIIEVHAQAATARQAADIANAVAEVFIQRETANTTAQLQSTAAQLFQELLKVKAHMDAAETQLFLLQTNNASESNIEEQRNILNAYEANYNSILTNYNQIQLQKLQMANSLEIVQHATPPDKPKSPQVWLNTILAAAMGLLLMIVLVLLLDWMDTTIKTPDDVAELAMLEPLGSVPLSKHPLLSADPLDLSMGNDNAVEWASVAISTNLSTLYKGRRALLVTGLLPIDCPVSHGSSLH